MVIFIIVKAARMFDGALNRTRFRVLFHSHLDCEVVVREIECKIVLIRQYTMTLDSDGLFLALD